jgi:tRNA G26 N,N-dimethylase Trm1
VAYTFFATDLTAFGTDKCIDAVCLPQISLRSTQINALMLFTATDLAALVHRKELSVKYLFYSVRGMNEVNDEICLPGVALAKTGG